MNENKIFQLISIVFVSVAMLIFSIKCNSVQAMKRGASEFGIDEECVEPAKKVDKKDECSVAFDAGLIAENVVEYLTSTEKDECSDDIYIEEKKDGMDEDLTSIIPSNDAVDVGDVHEIEKDIPGIAMIEVSEVGKIELTEEQIQEKMKILEKSLEKAILKLNNQEDRLYLTRNTKVVGNKDYETLSSIINELQSKLETKEIDMVLFSYDFPDRIDARNVDVLIELCDFFVKNKVVYFVTENEPVFKAFSKKNSTKNVNSLDSLEKSLPYSVVIFKESLPHAVVINDCVLLVYADISSTLIGKSDFTGETVDKIRKYKNSRRKKERGSEVYLSELLTRYLKNSEADTRSFQIIERDQDVFILYTPFGSVYIELSENGDPIVSVENYVIEIEDGKPTGCIKDKAYSYDELKGWMDCYVQDRYILQVFYEYLSIRGNDLSTIERPSFICDDPMLACFCGILVVAEPYRFEDGGKLSRASLRMMYALMGNGVEDPYSQIFVSAQADSVRCLLKGEDIGEFQEEFGDGLAVFSHVKNPARKDEESLYPIGGKQQQLNQITGSKTKHSFESLASYADNLVRMRCSDGYASDTDC